MVVASATITTVVIVDIGEEIEKTTEKRKYIGILFFALIVCEIGLYSHSSYEKIINIKVIIETDCKCNKDQIKITYFDASNNSEIKEYKLQKTNFEMADFLTSVKTARTYIEYVPFVKYVEKTEYTRNLPEPKN